MTVIVQPITVPPPESASDVIAQYLQKLLGTLTYENFAGTQNGEVTIYDTKFYYRVGLFLAVPTEAIIAAGQFVKMHQIKEKAKWWTGLKVIDPERPDECLYGTNWCPPSIPTQGPLGYSTQYTQQSLLAPNGLAALGQWKQPNPALNQRLHAAAQLPSITPYSPPTLWGKIFGTP
jgi:hypothetical protein